MLEIILYITIVLAVIAASTSLFLQARLNRQVFEAQSYLYMVTTTAQTSILKHPDPPVDLCEHLAKAGQLPSSDVFFVADNYRVTHSFSSDNPRAMFVAQANVALLILDDIPREICMRLGAVDENGNGSVGINISNMVLNRNVTDVTETSLSPPVDIDTLAANCIDGGKLSVYFPRA